MNEEVRELWIAIETYEAAYAAVAAFSDYRASVEWKAYGAALQALEDARRDLAACKWEEPEPLPTPPAPDYDLACDMRRMADEERADINEWRRAHER